jgi:hypothetical protein
MRHINTIAQSPCQRNKDQFGVVPDHLFERMTWRYESTSDTVDEARGE